MEIVAGLTVAAVVGLFAFAWNHPKAYDALMPWAAALAALVAVFFIGLTIGFDAGVERLRPLLTTDGVKKVEAIAKAFNRPMAIAALSALVALFALPMLGGLKFLPRGKD